METIRQERRGHPRRALIAQIDCSTAEERFSTSTLDISEGGVLLVWQTGEAPKPNAVLDVQFSLPVPPKVEVIKARGIVVRATPSGGVAVRFTDLQKTHREAIRRYLEAPVAVRRS
jgi:c-di-GMP-binding flagellar brake protein YcgR